MTIKETEQKTGLARSHIRFYDFLWGKKITWGILIGVCFLVAVCSVGYLPAKIPIQWHNGAVSSFADKKFIFAFPAACILIRYVLRPFLWRWLKINIIDSDSITDYITNYLCFVALSVEIFIILFVKEIVKYVTVILYIDTFVFLGPLLFAIYQITKKKQ